MNVELVRCPLATPMSFGNAVISPTRIVNCTRKKVEEVKEKRTTEICGPIQSEFLNAR